MRIAAERHQAAVEQPSLGPSIQLQQQHGFQLVQGTEQLSQREYVKMLVKAALGLA
jgi:hypothetical protein